MDVFEDLRAAGLSIRSVEVLRELRNSGSSVVRASDLGPLVSSGLVYRRPPSMVMFCPRVGHVQLTGAGLTDFGQKVCSGEVSP